MHLGYLARTSMKKDSVSVGSKHFSGEPRYRTSFALPVFAIWRVNLQRPHFECC